MGKKKTATTTVRAPRVGDKGAPSIGVRELVAASAAGAPRLPVENYRAQATAADVAAKVLAQYDRDDAAHPADTVAMHCVHQDSGRRTCLVVFQGEERVEFIPMGSDGLDVVSMDAKRFNTLYRRVPYPVNVAAAKYLKVADTWAAADAAAAAEGKKKAKSPSCSAQAREHLEFLASSKLSEINKKRLPVAQAAPSPEMDAVTRSKVRKAQSEAVTLGVERPGKATAPDSGKPLSTDDKESNMAAKKAAAKPKGGAKKTKGAAPAAGATKLTAAELATKKAAAKAEKRGTGDEPYKVGSVESVKRGFLKEFVDAAASLKKFSRNQLVQAFKKKVDEERAVRYFFYCTGHDIFVKA